MATTNISNKNKLFSATNGKWKYYIFAIAMVILVLLIMCGYLYTTLRVTEPLTEGDFPAQAAWEFDFGERVFSTPLIKDQIMYVRTVRSICAFNLENQEKVWCAESPSDGFISTNPMLFKDKIVVPEKDSSVAVFSALDGSRAWRTGNRSSVNWVEAISVYGDKLFVASNDDHLVSYDIETGRIVWAATVPDRSSLYLAAGPQAVFLAAGQRLYAYDASQGSLLWYRDFQSLIRPILLDKKTLYLTMFSNSEFIIAIDLETGEQKWEVSSFDIDDQSPLSVTLLGDAVYVGREKLFAIDNQTGKVLWVTEAVTGLHHPIILKDRLYIFGIDYGEKRSYILSLEKETGQVKGRLLVQTLFRDKPVLDPIVYQGWIIVPFGDQRIFSFEP